VAEVAQAMALRKLTDDDLARVSAVATKVAFEFRKRDEAQRRNKAQEAAKAAADRAAKATAAAKVERKVSPLLPPPKATSAFSLFGGRAPKPPPPPPAPPKDGLAALFEAFGFTSGPKSDASETDAAKNSTPRGKK
jgi:hypothetical protein